MEGDLLRRAFGRSNKDYKATLRRATLEERDSLRKLNKAFDALALGLFPGLNALEAVLDARDLFTDTTVAEIAERSGEQPGTARRVLHALCDRGVIEVNQGHGPAPDIFLLHPPTRRSSSEKSKPNRGRGIRPPSK